MRKGVAALVLSALTLSTSTIVATGLGVGFTWRFWELRRVKASPRPRSGLAFPTSIWPRSVSMGSPSTTATTPMRIRL